MNNQLVRFLKRGLPWRDHETLVLCEFHIKDESLRLDNVVIPIMDSSHACVTCEANKRMKKGKSK